MAKNEHQRPAHRNLLPAERQNEILNLLTNHNVVTIPELAQKLDTSDITIRRDLASLSKAGLLKRVRGGAMSVSSTTDSNDQQSFTAESDSIPSPISLPADQPSIGVMLPEPSFFWPNVINHMHEAAARYGMRLIVKESAYEEDVHEADILQDFADEPTVCGIIAAPNAHPEFGKQTWDWIERSSIPVVAVERDQPILGTCYTDSVRTNHRYGVRKAAVHFLQHGHSRRMAGDRGRHRQDKLPIRPDRYDALRYARRQRDRRYHLFLRSDRSSRALRLPGHRHFTGARATREARAGGHFDHLH